MIDQIQDRELEQKVLSSCIESEEIYLDTTILLDDDCFYSFEHQAIWKMMREMDESGIGINQDMLLAKIQQYPNSEANTQAFKLIQAKEPETNITEYIKTLVEWKNRRNYFSIAHEILNAIADKKDSKEITSQIEKKTLSMDLSIGSRARTYEECRQDVLSQPTVPIIETGMSFIDEIIGGGLQLGQLILLMGDAEAGKTVLATQILRNVSRGIKTLFFCFEFTVRDFVLQNEDRKRKFNHSNMIVVDNGYALSDIEREIKIQAKRGVKFVLIDSQMRIDNSANKGTIEEKESDKFSKLAKLCHRLDIVIVLISQQGKEDTKGGIHTPMGSKKGAHEANQIWYIHKPKPQYDKETGDHLNKTDREFEISKNKQNGQYRRVKIKLQPIPLEFVKFYNKEPKITHYKEDTNQKNGEVVTI